MVRRVADSQDQPTVTVVGIKISASATGAQLFRQIEWAVDKAYGRISDRFQEADISLERYEELRKEFPEFFKRITDIEDTLSGSTPWAQAVPLLQSWAKNWDFLIDRCVPPAKRVNPEQKIKQRMADE